MGVAYEQVRGEEDEKAEEKGPFDNHAGLPGCGLLGHVNDGMGAKRAYSGVPEGDVAIVDVARIVYELASCEVDDAGVDRRTDAQARQLHLVCVWCCGVNTKEVRERTSSVIR